MASTRSIPVPTPATQADIGDVSGNPIREVADADVQQAGDPPQPGQAQGVDPAAGLGRRLLASTKGAEGRHGGRGGCLQYAGLSASSRQNNDDRWQVAARMGLFVLAGGVTGYAACDLAAELAVQTACQLVPDLIEHGLAPREALARAMAVCNEEIRELAPGRPGGDSMAATLVCALVVGKELHLAHAGDVRAYLLRAGRLLRQTRDHSVGRQIVEAGRLTEDQVALLPARRILTRALGLAERIEPELSTQAWDGNDTLILCSDGLTSALPDPVIEHLLLAAAATGPAGQARALIDGALQAGAPVSATVLVAAPADRHGLPSDLERPH